MSFHFIFVANFIRVKNPLYGNYVINRCIYIKKIICIQFCTSVEVLFCGYADILEATDSGEKPTSVTRTRVTFGSVGHQGQ